MAMVGNEELSNHKVHVTCSYPLPSTTAPACQSMTNTANHQTRTLSMGARPLILTNSTSKSGVSIPLSGHNSNTMDGIRGFEEWAALPFLNKVHFLLKFVYTDGVSFYRQP